MGARRWRSLLVHGAEPRRRPGAGRCHERARQRPAGLCRRAGAPRTVALLDRGGRVVMPPRGPTRWVAIVFRQVPPGPGYRAARRRHAIGRGHGHARTARLRRAPRSMTRRCPTAATAICAPATGRAWPSTSACPGPASGRPVPDAGRVRRLRLRRPRGRGERHQRGGQPAGLRGRRRQHARHRLLGRLVRLLRAAPEPRRLRRHRDGGPPAVGARAPGGHAGHLLRRHQPAVRRRHRPARTWPRSRR